MTGTAETEANEFNDIYKLPWWSSRPTSRWYRADKPTTRLQDPARQVQRGPREIQSAHQRGQPVLVGTTSVESSEVLSRMLKLGTSRTPC
jgi:preprotein translocase subunit SecA